MGMGQRDGVKLVVALLIAYVLVYFHRTMTGVMKPEVEYYASYYGVEPNLLLAVMASAYFYSYAVSQAFMGPLLDHYGIKRVGGSMLTVLGIATFLMCLPNPYALIIGRALIGVSAPVAFLSYMRASSLGFDANMQGRLSSYAPFAASLSTILASYPLRCLLNSFGISFALTLLASLALVQAAAVYFTSNDTGSRGRSANCSKPLSTLRWVSREWHVWGMGFMALATVGIGLAYQSAWGQLHLERAFSMDKDTISLYLMVIAVAYMVSCIPTGYLSDKLKRRKPFLISSAVASVIAWLLLYLSTAWRSAQLLLLSLTLMGLSQGLHIVVMAMAREPYDPAASGTIMALFNLILFAGIAVLQNVCTIIDFSWSIGINILIALAGVAVSLLVRETYGGGRQPVKSP